MTKKKGGKSKKNGRKPKKKGGNPKIKKGPRFQEFKSHDFFSKFLAIISQSTDLNELNTNMLFS